MGISLDEANNMVAKKGISIDDANAQLNGTPATKPDSFLDTLKGLYLEPIANMASGVAGKFAGDTAGLDALLWNKLTGDSVDPAQLKQKIQSAMTFEPRTNTGKAVSTSIFNPFVAIGKGLNAVGSAAGDYVSGGTQGEVNQTSPQAMIGNFAREGIPQAASILMAKYPVTTGVVSGGLPAAIGKGAYNIVEPYTKAGNLAKAGRTLNAAAGDVRPQVISALENSSPAVPGSNLTAGLAATSARSPEFSALQTEVASIKPQPYNVIEQGQQAARAKVPQDIAGGATVAERSAALKVAKDARTAATEPFFKQAELSKAKVDVKPVTKLIDEILSKNPKNDSITTPLSGIKSDLTPHAAATPLPAGPTGIRPITPRPQLDVSPKTLKSLSDNIGNKIAAKNPDGSPAFDVSSLVKIKKVLDEQIGLAEPAYAHAMATHKLMSVPVNRLQIGQVLTDKLVPPTGIEGTTPFLKALDKPKKVIKEATGFGAGKDLGKILEPDQLSGLNAVNSELQNNLAFNRLAQKGAPALKKIVADELGAAQWPTVLKTKVTLFHYLYNVAKGEASNRTTGLLSDIMQNPSATAKLMRDNPVEAGILKDAIKTYGQAVAVTSQSGRENNQPGLLGQFGI